MEDRPSLLSRLPSVLRSLSIVSCSVYYCRCENKTCKPSSLLSPFTRTSCRDQSFVSSPKYELKKVFIVRLTFSAPTKMEFPLVKVVPPSFIFHSHPLIFLFRLDRRTIQHKRGYNTICFCQSGLFHGPGCALFETIIHKRERERNRDG